MGITLDEDFFSFSRYSDRNEDGIYTLSEVLHMPLINLPAPVYNFYTQVDKNKDEKLSRGEAMDFIRRTFAIIDSNSDCYIDEDEVVSLLERVGVPSDQQLAVRLVMQQYLTLGSSLIKQFTAAADVDGDGTTTVQEVIDFNDFNFIEWNMLVVTSMVQPSRAWDYLISPRRYGPRSGQEIIAMWLTSLQELMDQPAYSGALPDNQCNSLDS